MTNKTKMVEECLVEHLPYEVGMLRAAMIVVLDAQEQMQMNIGIELFCLHLRNLIEFFKDGADFKPREFTVSEYKRPTRPFFSDQTCQRIANEITHLTRQRFTDTHKKITNEDCLKFYRIMEEEIARFEQALTCENSAKWKVAILPVQVSPGSPGTVSATNAIQMVHSTAGGVTTITVLSAGKK